MDIRGKVFVITGAGNGVGRELALLLLGRGAKAVAGIDKRSTHLDETEALVTQARVAGTFSKHVADVTDRAAIEALPATIEALHGPVDGVINDAGIIHAFEPISKLTIEEIKLVVDTNFWGTVYVTKAFLPGLLARPEAKLIDFSSMGALAPVPGQTAYGASKGAVKAFTEGIYAELLETNVSVSVVFPGGMQTNIAGNSGIPVPDMATIDPKVAQMMAPTTPQAAAKQIVEEAIEKGEFRIVIGSDAHSLDRTARLMPTKVIKIIADRMKSIIGG